MLNLEAYVSGMLGNNTAEVIESVRNDVKAGIEAQDVVSKGMIPAMTVIGEKFQRGDIYIPEMMMAANTISAVLEHFKDQLAGKEEKKIGSVVIGTVKGDLHDIGADGYGYDSPGAAQKCKELVSV